MELPSAGLEGVAEQIRKDFANPVKEQVEAPVPVTVKKKLVSQETFDLVVKENVEEFDMDLEEAMSDARQQFEGMDLSMIVTSVEEKQANEKVKVIVDEIDKHVKTKDVKPHLIQLGEACENSNSARIFAGMSGAVGACTFICKEHIDDQELILLSLKTLGVLLKSFENREFLPFQGIEAICKCLKHYLNDSQVLICGFNTISLAITKHEANKRTFKDVEINSIILECLEKYQDDHQVILAVSKFIKIYLSDDDRRPGVQPGTFVRARELGENYEASAVKPLISFIQKQTTLEKGDVVTKTMITLKSLAVNDLICKHFITKGGLDHSLVAFEAHITDESIAVSGCSLLKAVSRNDDIKRTVGKGKGLGLLLTALDEHSESAKVAEQALACLNVLCLRQSDNCDRVVELGCLQLVSQTMTKHENHANLQRQGISAMRNMVSNNRHLTQKVLDHGAENLIRKARATHPICEEVAYAALRDLGLPYHN